MFKTCLLLLFTVGMIQASGLGLTPEIPAFTPSSSTSNSTHSVLYTSRPHATTTSESKDAIKIIYLTKKNGHSMNVKYKTYAKVYELKDSSSVISKNSLEKKAKRSNANVVLIRSVVKNNATLYNYYFLAQPST